MKKSITEKILLALMGFNLSALLTLGSWTLKTVVDLKTQVAGLDARLTALTSTKNPQVAKQ